MKKLKKFTARLMSLAVAAVTALSVGVNASAEAITYKWGVDRSLSNADNRYGWIGNGSTKFSVDSNVHTNNSWFSIKIENTNYNTSLVERTYNVQPRTSYKFSAMVKYSGYQLNPEAKTQNTGACIGKAPFYDDGAYYFYPNESGYSASSEWTLLEYEFITSDETTVNLCLQNGGNCKGTAWFSDVKLEKAEVTNNWDILAVFFNNADANVSLNGNTVHHKMSLRESDINDINKYVLDKLPQTLKTMSNNKVSVNSIDRYYIDEALTEKDLVVHSYLDSNKTIPASYHVSISNSQLVNRVLDSYLAEKHYEQILIFAPLFGLTYLNAKQTNIWWGTTGAKYKNISISQVSNAMAGDFAKDEYDARVVVHEICHCLEADSKALNNKTADFHDMFDYPSISEREWTIGYMNDTLPESKKGLDPQAFYRPNGRSTLVDSDMTTGTGITPGSSSVLPPAPKKLTVEAVEDNKVKVSWDSVSGVSGYQLVLFKDAAYTEVWKPFDCKSSTTSTQLSPIIKGNQYYFGIRTAAAIDGTTVYSDWTYLTYTHEGVKVIYGDINNDGKSNFDDVITLVQMYANRQALDQRTLTAAGVNGRDYIQFNDILEFVKKYANRS